MMIIPSLINRFPRKPHTYSTSVLTVCFIIKERRNLLWAFITISSVSVTVALQLELRPLICSPKFLEY